MTDHNRRDSRQFDTLDSVEAAQFMRGAVLEDGPYTLKYGIDGRDVFQITRTDGEHRLNYEFESVERVGKDNWKLRYGDSQKGGKMFLNDLDGYEYLRKTLVTIQQAFGEKND